MYLFGRIGRALWIVLCGQLALACPPAATAQDGLNFFHPVILRRPVIENAAEFEVHHEGRRSGNDTLTVLTIDLPIRSWWQFELAVPATFHEPDTGPSTAGIGDVAIETKAVVFASSQYRLLVASGVNVTVPTGSPARGLGGTTTVTPFITAGVKLGDFDVLGEAGYKWIVPSDRGGGGQEQQIAAGLAMGYAVRSWLTPFAELTSVSNTHGADASSTHPSRRTQLYLTSGFNFQMSAGRTLVFGVQLPVTNARMLDYGVRAGLIWDF